MHKLTDDRIKWGVGALLSGVAVALGVLSWSLIAVSRANWAEATRAAGAGASGETKLDHRTSAGRRTSHVVVKKPVQVQRRGKDVMITFAPAVRAALRQYFPGFSRPHLADFDPEALEESGANEPKPWVPFADFADFDGNGLPDIALLLKNPRRQWLLVALHQTQPGVFRPNRLSHWTEENPKADIDIRTLDAGYAAFPFSASGGAFHSFPIPHPGLIFEIPGEAGTLYYFKGNRYHHVHFGW
jgi:hypothetical protein